MARPLKDRRPHLMVTDPPYGIELDSEWRDRAGLSGCGPAQSSYMKRRTEGHTETTISGDTRADWSEAFELVPSLEVAYVWHASKFTREVLDGLLRIGFLHHQQIIWNKGRTVLTRTHYRFQHEPCWYVRKKNAAWFGKAGEFDKLQGHAERAFVLPHVVGRRDVRLASLRGHEGGRVQRLFTQRPPCDGGSARPSRISPATRVTASPGSASGDTDNSGVLRAAWPLRRDRSSLAETPGR